MGRKKKYLPKPFESRNPKSTFAMIFEDMIMSDAWKDLTRSQMALYLVCKMQMYAAKSKEKKVFGEEYEKNNMFFTMSPKKWMKTAKSKGYDLYTNKRTFHNDMQELINHGFIDCVHNGAGYLEMNLYKYSDRWIKYGTSEFEVPDSVKTNAMLNKESISKIREVDEDARYNDCEITEHEKIQSCS